jgi:hypothetical protein
MDTLLSDDREWACTLAREAAESARLAPASQKLRTLLHDNRCGLQKAFGRSGSRTYSQAVALLEAWDLVLERRRVA